jgi:tRNA threonylcarbamoyladenosine biosynthesis protein TsaB
MILAIDTTGQVLGIVLWSDEGLISEITVRRPHCHDECLAPGLLQALELGGADMDAVHAVAVVSGPGSYTGLRIGMAVAKGIALSRSIPLCAVPTFDAMRHRAVQRIPLAAYTLCTVLDARREDVYYAVFAIDGDEVSKRHAPASGSAADLAALLPAGTLLSGDGARKVVACAERPLTVLPGPEAFSLAPSAAGLAEAMLARGETTDAATCEPLYLRDFTPKSAKSLF